jgi:hypothetical protein
MGKRVSSAQLQAIEDGLNAKVTAFQSEVNARCESMSRKIQVLEALERKMAAAVMELLASKDTEGVEGYDIQTIHTSTGPRWVWKHFLRGARSKKSYETREACVKNAKQDAIEQLAYPAKDLSTMITQSPKGKIDGNRVKQRPAPPLVTRDLPHVERDDVRPPGVFKSPRRI